MHSAAIKQFIHPGNTLAVVLIHADSYKANRSATLDYASAAAADKMVTAIPFCPIENHNIITLTVRINSFTAPMGKAISMDDGSRLKTLADLSGSELTIVLGKEDTMAAKEPKSKAHVNHFHWMVALGDSTAPLS